MSTQNVNALSSDNDFAHEQGQEQGQKISATIPSSSSGGQPQENKRVAKRSVKKAQDAFRTISEVADKLDVQQHVLRFWETKFSQVRPLKRGGGRRYYRPEDVALLERIHHLLYTEGYTIKGVQKLLKGQGKQQIIANSRSQEAKNQNPAPVASPKVPTETPAKTKTMTAQQRAVLEIMLAELKAMRSMIKV
jgi:DNA-binding transcriptional MerR regulator